ncbi:MAG: LAGLIDADG family homing endonuclease [Promethearchaeota archaeon]
MQREIKHYNRWLTNNIQGYLKGLKGEIRVLFEPYIEFKKMGTLFGLYKNYIPTNRMHKYCRKIIAKNTLDKMRAKFKKFIEIWIEKYPHLVQSLLLVQSYIMKYIDEYEVILQPKPSPDYQMYKFHPAFKRNYFEIIDTYEKAYWLGFLFADGWIAIEHKKSGDYYRMGLQLSYSDKRVVKELCKCIGLNPSFIKIRLVKSDFSTKIYPISEIRWGDQKMAQDLLKIGMRYENNEEKGRRVKTPKLPNLKNRNLMLAFLLGFYDGDGTLGYDKKTGKIRPRIASSDIEFLRQIKNFFGIKYKISSTAMLYFNIRKKKMIKTRGSRLDIEKEIFKKMLSVYKKSLERKRVSLDYFNGTH